MSNPGSERRKATRYACVLKASWEGGKSSRLGDGWVGRVLDISITGLGLHLGEGFAPGTILAIGLHGGNDSLSPIEVRVVRGAQNPDSTWTLGAEFVTPLTEAQLQSLMSQ